MDGQGLTPLSTAPLRHYAQLCAALPNLLSSVSKLAFFEPEPKPALCLRPSQLYALSALLQTQASLAPKSAYFDQAQTIPARKPTCFGPLCHPCTQVAVFHGAKRAADTAGLEDADVVLTTYSVLESEYRK